MAKLRMVLAATIVALVILSSGAAWAQARALHLFYFDLAGTSTTRGMSNEMREYVRRQKDSLMAKPGNKVVLYRVNSDDGKLATSNDEVEATYQAVVQENSEPSTNESRDCRQMRNWFYQLGESDYRNIYIHVYLSKQQAKTLSGSYRPFYHFFLEDLTTSPIGERFYVELVYPPANKGETPVDKSAFTFLNKHPSFRNPTTELTIRSL